MCGEQVLLSDAVGQPNDAIEAVCGEEVVLRAHRHSLILLMSLMTLHLTPRKMSYLHHRS